MFNGFLNAAYLAWRWGETRPLYIDHLQAYSDALTRDYIDITNATPRGQSLLETQNVGYVLIKNPRTAVTGAQWPRIKDYLNDSPDWQLVYLDFNGVPWVRKTPETAAMRRDIRVPPELR